MTARVALVNARAARGLDEDMPPLTAALAAAGAHGECVEWDDPQVEPDTQGLIRRSDAAAPLLGSRRDFEGEAAPSSAATPDRSLALPAVAPRP